MRRLSMCVIAALTLLCGCQRDISGTYLAADKATVCWLQLVRTPDDHLTGQFDCSVLGADGKIEMNNVPVTGAVNAANVTITISKFFGLQTVTLGGILDGNKLTLSGGASASFILKRADFNEYQQQLRQLDASAQAVQAANTAAESRERAEQAQQAVAAQQAQRAFAIQQAQQNIIVQIDQLIGKMQRFDSEADLHLSRFPGVEKGYQAITAKMNEYVERERRLAGNPNAAVARSQLSVAATQASLATDQLHYQGQSLQSTLEINVKPMADEATNLDAICHERGTTPRPDLTPAQIDSEACGRLTNALTPFRQKYDATRTGLAHLEQVYAQEKTTQQELLQTTQKLE